MRPRAENQDYQRHSYQASFRSAGYDCWLVQQCLFQQRLFPTVPTLGIVRAGGALSITSLRYYARRT